MLLRRIARPLLSAVFIGQGVESLRNPHVAAEAARPTVEGLRRLPAPVAEKVPADVEGFALVTAAVQVGAGLLLASGRLPRTASTALAFTVVPGSLGSHMFWRETDPERKAAKRRDFLNDVSLLGGLMIAAADTAGKPSLGWRGRRAAQRMSESIAGAVPGWESSISDSDLGERFAHGMHAGAERGRELISAAAEKGAPVVDAALQHGDEWAEVARERGAELMDVARHRGDEWAGIARERGAELVDSARHLSRSR